RRGRARYRGAGAARSGELAPGTPALLAHRGATRRANLLFVAASAARRRRTAGGDARERRHGGRPRPAVCRLGRPASGIGAVDLGEYVGHRAGQAPVGVVAPELAHVADPPDVVPDAVAVAVAPVELLARDRFAQLDRLEHGTATVAAAADVVDLPHARGQIEVMERADQVVGVNVVAHLLALVAEHLVG